MAEICFITTCMGRLASLQQTLPKAVEQKNATCVVVDYSCPDRCGEWVAKNFPQVKVVGVQGQQWFNPGRSRNLGAQTADSPWLCFVDADVMLDPTFSDVLIGQARVGNFYRPQPVTEGLGRVTLCARGDFSRAGGFDENMQGTEPHDDDLFGRFQLMGVVAKTFPAYLVRHVPHNDIPRTRFYEMQDQQILQTINRMYLRAKFDMMRLMGDMLVPDVARRLYDAAHQEIIGRTVRNLQDAEMNIDLPGQTAPNGWELSRSIQYKLNQKATASNLFVRSSFQSVRDALSTIRRRWPEMKSDARDEPIFILASSFRSGSTLMQRMLINQCYLWGEPYGQSGLIDHLAAPLTSIRNDWPFELYFPEHISWEGDLSQKWTANLYPHPKYLLRANIEFFREMFAVPAVKQGCSRWGFKEVRLDIDHAAYLHWLFPNAKFVLLYRNPYSCYYSYRKYPNYWYRRWPDDRIDSPERFGKHWLDLTTGFLEHHQEIGGMVIKYEDLIRSGFDTAALQSYLRCELNLTALEHKVGHIPVSQSPRGEVTADEIDRLHSVVGATAERLGYNKPAQDGARNTAPPERGALGD